MKKSLALLTLLVISATTFAQQLPYSVRDDVRKQTMNMAEIERELGQLSAQAQAGPSAAQQALLAQFQAMLNANPQLKAQFNAASPQEQSAFMAQMGIATGAGSGQMNNYGWLEQRLDGVQAVIDRAPADHPDIIALQQRVNTARGAITQTEQAEEANTQGALAANDLSEFPNFEQDLAAAEAMAGQVASALSLVQDIVATQSSKPGTTDMWLITNEVSSGKIRQLGQSIDAADGFLNQIQTWDQQYQPLFARSATFKNRWYANLQYMPQLMAKLTAEAPAALQVLAQNAQHNTGVIEHMIDYATSRRMAAYFEGGIAQTQREIAVVEQYYPTKSLNGAPQKSQITNLKASADAVVAKGLEALKDLVVAEQRMPADNYDGDDAEALKAKANALIKRQFPGQEIMDVAICCDWDIEDYEHWVERAGDWIKERVHYREIQIGVLMPLNEERAVIRVVGIRQYYSSGKELVDVIRELPMLRKNV